MIEHDLFLLFFLLAMPVSVELTMYLLLLLLRRRRRRFFFFLFRSCSSLAGSPIHWQQHRQHYDVPRLWLASTVYTNERQSCQNEIGKMWVLPGVCTAASASNNCTRFDWPARPPLLIDESFRLSIFKWKLNEEWDATLIFKWNKKFFFYWIRSCCSFHWHDTNRFTDCIEPPATFSANIALISVIK